MPTPSPTLEPKVDTTLERRLGVSGKQVLRLDIPDSSAPGIVIISPLSYSASDLPAPSIHETSTEDSLRIYESRRRRASSTYRYHEALRSYTRKPTLPRVDVEKTGSVDSDGPDDVYAGLDSHLAPPIKPFVLQQFALSPIEKYYDHDTEALTDVSNHPPQCLQQPSNDSFIVEVPLDDAPSPRKKGHGHTVSDLSKKFKRYSGTTPAAFARKARERNGP